MSDHSDDEDFDCPLCMEEMDLTDKYFKPCPCGYQICRFCWNYINKDLNGLCPACRRPYTEETVEFKPVSPEELIKIKAAKKKKSREKKEQELMSRKQLANVRVVQKNLVYVLGLSNKIATEEVLRQHDYFGQYGKINKVVINRRINNTGPTPVTSNGVYITFAKKEDAAKAIDAVDGSICDGRMIRATFGTTKYCSFFLKNLSCQNPGCQYLHEPGEEADTFLKEESNKKTTVAKAFPVVPVVKKDDKEESALPATASWAKPARQISHYIGVSAGSAVAESPVPSEHEDAPPSPKTVNKKKSKNNVKKSPVLAAAPVVVEEEPTLHDLGFSLMLKYSGVLDPFNDKFDLTNLGLSDSLSKITTSFVGDEEETKNLDLRKSRFERIFGSEMEVLDPRVADLNKFRGKQFNANNASTANTNNELLAFLRDNQIRTSQSVPSVPFSDPAIMMASAGNRRDYGETGRLPNQQQLHILQQMQMLQQQQQRAGGLMNILQGTSRPTPQNR